MKQIQEEVLETKGKKTNYITVFLKKCKLRPTISVKKLLFTGLLLKVLDETIYPNLSQDFPGIYGFYQGLLNFYEFSVISVLKLIYHIFTGGLQSYWNNEYLQAVNNLLLDLGNWISNIHF